MAVSRIFPSAYDFWNYCRPLVKSCLRCFASAPHPAKAHRRPPNSKLEKTPSKPLLSSGACSSVNIIFEERVRKQMDQQRLARQNFDYFLVLDFEATCDKDRKFHPQEIIEFPVVMVDAQTMEPVSTFHKYVQPRVNRDLTPFCTQLTGIIQDMVDDQPHFEEVLGLFNQWLIDKGLLDRGKRWSFVTCGDWDLGTMLPSQANYFGVALPSYFRTWVNIKHSFSESIGHYPRGLMLMLESLGIQHKGRHHSGIDDCKNILRIMKVLAERNYTFRPLGRSRDSSTRSRMV